MFGGALVSFVKRLFGRAACSSDDEEDSEPPATDGDHNGNVPASACRSPVTPRSALRCRCRRPRTATVELVCRRCGGTVSPAAVDQPRWTSPRRGVTVLDRHTRDSDTADDVDACSCSICYQSHRCHHPTNGPHHCRLSHVSILVEPNVTFTVTYVTFTAVLLVRYVACWRNM